MPERQGKKLSGDKHRQRKKTAVTAEHERNINAVWWCPDVGIRYA